MQDASYIERFIEKDFHDWKDNWADSKTLLVKGDYVKIGLNQEKPYK